MKSSRQQNLALQILYGDAPIVDVGGGIFTVPSQSHGAERYTVNLTRSTCTCPFFRKERRSCKHVFAAQAFRGKAQTGTAILAPQPNRYKNPACYDAVKINEERGVRELLRCLGALVPYQRRPGSGRPPIRLGDMLVCAGLASYLNRPSRKAIGDPALLRASGLVQGLPPSTLTLRVAMMSQEYNTAVKAAIVRTADCVRRLDTWFAIDATYLKTPLSQIEVQQRQGKQMVVSRNLNCKLFLAVGCKSLMAVGATVTNENVSDQTQFIPLLQQFAGRFLVEVVLADAGFNKAEHFEVVRSLGARAFIDFDRNAKPSGSPHFDEQLDLYKTDHDAWLEVYRFRPLIETVNSMFKRVLKRQIRARYEMSRENEVLTGVLMHNLCRLLMLREQHGIEIPWADDRARRVMDRLDDAEEVVA